MEKYENLNERLEKIRKEERGILFEMGFIKEIENSHFYDMLKQEYPNINPKKIQLGNYIKNFQRYSPELTINGLESFIDSEIEGYDEEKEEIRQLIDIIKKKEISKEVVDEQKKVFSEYGFLLEKKEKFLLIERYSGQCSPMGNSYDREFFKIKIV